MADETENKVDRKAEIKKAWRIRRKPIEERTEEEKVWFAAYETTKLKRGKQVPDPATEQNDEPLEDDEGVADLGNEPIGPDEPIPPPPPAPRVEIPKPPKEEQEPQKGSTDWRKKYRQSMGGDGRERTVITIASQWLAILEWASEQIKMSGGTPMMDPKALFPAIVITVDDFLPERVSIKPQHIAAVGTTLIIGQRIARHKKIGEAIEARKREPVFQEPPPPPPPPPTPATPGPDRTEPVKPEPIIPPIRIATDAMADDPDTLPPGSVF